MSHAGSPQARLILTVLAQELVYSSVNIVVLDRYTCQWDSDIIQSAYRLQEVQEITNTP